MGHRSVAVTTSVSLFVVLAALATGERRVSTQSSTPTHTAIDLGTLGGSSSVARGVAFFAFSVAGSSTTASGATRAFLRRTYNGQFTDLGTLGGSNSEARALSEDGSYVAGRAKLATGKYHAFLWLDGSGGPMVDLGTLGGSESGANGVSGFGTVVGWSYTTGDTATRAFMYRNGAMSPVNVSFGGTESVALAVNNLDHVVGRATLAGNTVSHAFLSVNGVVTDLGSPAGTSVATAINDSGQVAGYWMATNNASSRAFIYTGGAMQTLPSLGGSFAYARAIDAAGVVVVGEADTSGGARHAVKWENGAIVDLNTLLAPDSGWVLQAATDTDDNGNIVGYGLHNGQTRAFLLGPPVDVSLRVNGHENQLDTNIPNPQEAGRSLDLGATVTHNATNWVTGLVITDTLTGPVEYTSWDTDAADCTQSGQTLTCRLKRTLGPGGFGIDLMLRVRTTGPGIITHTATVRADQADPALGNNTATESNRILSLASFTLKTPVVGGSPALGRTTLTSPTGSGGSRIRLSSSNPAVASVPSEFDVLPWSNDGLWREFYVTTQRVTQETQVQISATFGLATITNTLTILPSTPSTPYGGTARAVPGTIQAEDFDSGGEGVAYHDTNTANNGGGYRPEAVDIEATRDTGGGYNVGWTPPGEWLKYTVNVASAGTYTLEARVASSGGGGIFHVEANGVDKTGPLTVPNTGGWQSWRSVMKAVTLGAGVQVLRVVFDQSGTTTGVANLNWIRLAPGGSTPYGGVARLVPGTVQAEDFDDGGEGVAYHDTTTGNSGGAYRTKHVDIQTTTDSGGGYSVGWTTAGEWLKYTVDVRTAGTYTLGVRVAANGAGGTFHVDVGGVNKTGPMTIPNTGGWQTWTTLTKTVTLAAGTQVVRLVLDANGPNGVFGNFNYLSFATVTAQVTDPVVRPGSLLAGDADAGLAGDLVDLRDGACESTCSPGFDTGRTETSGPWAVTLPRRPRTAGDGIRS